jgi:hypothetical protein
MAGEIQVAQRQESMADWEVNQLSFNDLEMGPPEKIGLII